MVKSVDAPIEVLVFDPITAPLARTIGSRISPLVILGMAALARAASIPFYASGSNVIAVLLSLAGFILDATDGKVARNQRHLVHTHGALDFILDQVLFVGMFAALAAHQIHEEHDPVVLALFVFLGIYLCQIAVEGTRFRIIGELGIDWRRPGVAVRVGASTHGDFGPLYARSRALRAYQQFQVSMAARFRVLPRPTTIEALALVFLVGPLVGMPWWLVTVGSLCMVPGILIGLASVLVLVQAQDAADATSGEADRIDANGALSTHINEQR